MTPYRLRAAFVALLLVVVGAAGVRYAAKIQKASSLGTQTRSAFLRWRPQVEALHAGVDIYRVHAYPNPPIMALVLTPLMSLPPVVGALLWFALKAGMAALMAVWAFRLVGPMPGWAQALAVLASLHPVLGDLAHGNVNLFVGFVVFGALECHRRGWNLQAGLWLALAIACKVTPALLLPYFAWKRSWKLVGATLVGLLLWLLVVPGAILGDSFNRTLLTSWFEVMVKPFAIDGRVTSEHANQSLPGATFRLLTREPSFVAYDEDDQPFGAEFHNVADVGPVAAKRLVQAGMALFALGVWFRCRGRSPSAAELSYILIGMLLFSERTWKHHAVTLILPCAVLASAAATKWWPRVVLAAFILLTVGPSVLGGAAQDAAMVYGAYTAAFILLAAGCLVLAPTGRHPIAQGVSPGAVPHAGAEPECA